jgi:L-ribulose-5-phosphate 4-epimerase
MEAYTELKKEFLEIKDDLYSQGLITPLGGNISIRCPDDANKVLVTPSGIYKKSLKPEQILCLDLQGNVLSDTKYKPTSETPIHLAIMRSRPDVNAVVHTHAVFATAFGVSGLEFQPITADAAMIGQLPIVEWTVTGSKESGEIISKALAGHQNYVLIRNHGLFVCGPNLQYAAGITVMIEAICKGLVLCKMMGVNPKVLAPDKVALIEELLKSHLI